MYQDSGPSRHVVCMCGETHRNTLSLFTLLLDAVQDVVYIYVKEGKVFHSSLLDVTAVHAAPHYAGFRCLAQVRLLLMQRRLHRQGESAAPIGAAQNECRTSSQTDYTQMGTDPRVACATTRRCGMMRARRQPEVMYVERTFSANPQRRSAFSAIRRRLFHLHVYYDCVITAVSCCTRLSLSSGIGNRHALPCATRFSDRVSLTFSQTLRQCFVPER